MGERGWVGGRGGKGLSPHAHAPHPPTHLTHLEEESLTNEVPALSLELCLQAPQHPLIPRRMGCVWEGDTGDVQVINDCSDCQQRQGCEVGLKQQLVIPVGMTTHV